MFRQSPKEGCETPGLPRFRWKRNKSTSPKAFSLPRRIYLPSSSRFGKHSPSAGMKEFSFFGPGEHRLKHDWALETTCLQEKKPPAAGMKKRRGRSLVLHWKKTKGGGAAFYSLIENLRIGEAFGRGAAFISFVEAERIQSIRREPKNSKLSLLYS